MTALPFSAKQRAALEALRGGVRKTNPELRQAIDVGKGGVLDVMTSLRNRGLARFVGLIGRGYWQLTQLGERTVGELDAAEGTP